MPVSTGLRDIRGRAETLAAVLARAAMGDASWDLGDRALLDAMVLLADDIVAGVDRLAEEVDR
jgi:hypothetical protein